MGRRRSVKSKAVDNESESKPIVIETAAQKPVKTEKKRPGRKRKSTSDEVSSGSTTASKTPSLVSTGKRRKIANKVNTESKIFSQKEKKAFYECLKENGISCLNDESLLERLFPSRSIPEIKAMIDGFSRKAQDLNRKAEESISGIETDPNASKQPIEKWFDIIHQMVPNVSKKDDISAILIDLFDEYRNELTEDDVIQSDEDIPKPNYRSVYDCITAALNGKYAKQMEPINALVVVKLIEELKQLIKNDLNMDEMSFLTSGIWWQIPKHTNAQKSNGDLLKAIHSQRRQQNTEIDVDINDDVDDQIQTQSDANIEDQRALAMNEQMTSTGVDYESLKSYPKLRKIIECLNPLRVPINLVANEYNRW